MLNVYDVRIDQSGTSASSNIIGNVVFDTNTTGRIVLGTANIKEGSNLYYTNARVKNQIISYGATAGFVASVSLTGDITGSGIGSVATTISNNAVSFSKIQNISSNKILGRVGSTGIIEQISLTSGLSLSGLTLGMSLSGVSIGTYNNLTVNKFGIITLASNKDYTTNQTITLSGDITGSGSSGITTTIGSNKVTYSKIQQVSGNKILGNPSGLLNNVSELALTSGLNLSGNTIGIITNGIINNMIRQSGGVSVIGRSVNSSGNVADIVSSSDGQFLKRVGGVLGFNTIGNSDLYNGIVTYSKIQNISGNKLLGKVGVSGMVQEISTTSGLTFSGLTLGLSNSGVSIGTYNNVTVNKFGIITSGLNKNYLTGNQGINLTGDISGYGTNAITTIIGANKVGYSKIQQVSGNKILGNSSNVLGNVKELALTSGLVLSGNTIGLSISGVSTGTYNNVTVNKFGIITSATNKDYITNQTITLSGDVSGSGSSGITSTIQPNVVSYSKIQQIGGKKLLGNPSGILGNVKELALTSGLALSGNTIGITTNGVTNTMIRQSIGQSIIGKATTGTGNVADIIASTNGQVLKRVGGVVGFNSLGFMDLPNPPYVLKSAIYNIALTDYTIDCSGTFTVTLPTAIGIIGKIFVINNSGTGTITIATTSSQNINNTTTKLITAQYSGYTLQSTGSNWIVIGAY